MIKLIPPKSYGEIKPLANSLGQPIRMHAAAEAEEAPAAAP